MQAAGESNLKRVTFELGGKSPVVVCPDYDGNWYLLLFCAIWLIKKQFSKLT